MSYNNGSDGTRGHRGAVQQHLTLISVLVCLFALGGAGAVAYWWKARERVSCQARIDRARDAIRKHTIELFRERRTFLMTVAAFVRHGGTATPESFFAYCGTIDQTGSGVLCMAYFDPGTRVPRLVYTPDERGISGDTLAPFASAPAGLHPLREKIEGVSSTNTCLFIHEIAPPSDEKGEAGRVVFLFTLNRIVRNPEITPLLAGTQFALLKGGSRISRDSPPERSGDTFLVFPEDAATPHNIHLEQIMLPAPFYHVDLAFDPGDSLTPRTGGIDAICWTAGILLGGALLFTLRHIGRTSAAIENQYEEDIDTLEGNVGALESAVKGLEGEKRQKAVEKLAVMGLMSGGLAHELKTPLSAVQNALHEIGELASEFKGLAGEYAASTSDPEVTAEDHAEIASDMTTRAEEMGRALALSGNALDTAMRHLSTFKDKTLGMEHAERVRFDVVKAVAGALEMLLPEAKAKGCRIAMRRPKQPVILLGDPHKLGQIAVNLVNNAIDAYQGQPGVVSVLVRSAGDTVELAVRDEGCGIAPEDHEQIFHGTFTSKADGKGMGLGLALCREIVEAHFEGRIELESTVGKGSSFRVVLPQSNDNDPDEGESNGA